MAGHCERWHRTPFRTDPVSDMRCSPASPAPVESLAQDPPEYGSNPPHWIRVQSCCTFRIHPERKHERGASNDPLPQHPKLHIGSLIRNLRRKSGDPSGRIIVGIGVRRTKGKDAVDKGHCQSGGNGKEDQNADKFASLSLPIRLLFQQPEQQHACTKQKQNRRKGAACLPIIQPVPCTPASGCTKEECSQHIFSLHLSFHSTQRFRYNSLPRQMALRNQNTKE